MPSSDTVHVFAYGTLSIRRLMAAVSGRTFACEPALLEGYARYALRGVTFPGLVEEGRSATDGVLWRDVDAASLARLDQFEGDWYVRRAVTVRAGSQQVAAETYLLVPAQRHRVSRRRWNLARFESRYLPRLLADYGAAAPATAPVSSAP